MADEMMDLLYHLVGKRIRTQRKRLEFTQDDLADRIGRTRTSVTNIENGRQHLPLHQLLRVAKALEIDLRDLLPSREELDDHPGTVPVQVGDTHAEVPEAAARVIRQVLEESTGGKAGRSRG